ncbi:hypothetical protein BJ912DRAFT_1057091 [Pholiota molesta]|nr:hypothetical protein BJ912DRAFT_1057091 [Pholiota molesta]
MLLGIAVTGIMAEGSAQYFSQPFGIIHYNFADTTGGSSSDRASIISSEHASHSMSLPTSHTVMPPHALTYCLICGAETFEAVEGFGHRGLIHSKSFDFHRVIPPNFPYELSTNFTIPVFALILREVRRQARSLWD